MNEWTERPELSAYIARQRWFGQGDTEVPITEVTPLAWLSDPASGVGVRFELVTAGSLYSVPLAYRTQPREDLSYGFIGAVPVGDTVSYVYDALHDPEARSLLLRGFVDGASSGDLTYTTLEGFALNADEASVLMAVEQSNSSVIVGPALVKFFRKLELGRNPDIEVQAALTTLGSEQISPLLGYISSGEVDLAMACTYERTATDGFESAKASVRALQDDEIRARDAGGDFASESERLGATLAILHDEMRQALPTGTWGSPDIEALIQRFSARLDRAIAMQPLVADYADRARAAYAAIKLDTPIPVQRIHGDFHLGQTLRTIHGWKIIDFEGEPAQALEDRVRLDCIARDVAGMLRSIDYAAHSVAIATGDEDNRYADDWARRNRIAFLRGYGHEGADAAAESDEAMTLLRAYEIDKAVYEVVYESNYRPDWVHIPLRALERLL